MCRFALVKTTKPSTPEKILTLFSDMAEASRAPDGDIQGDGWGISWKQNNTWHRYTSVDAIWESKETFAQFPATNLFMIHARSASFVSHKDNIEYNQPFCNDSYSFVFNGLLKGMQFPRPLAGKIGAQKIWALFQEHVSSVDAQSAMQKSIDELTLHAREIQALNLGISDGKNIYTYCQSSSNNDYYSLHAHQTLDISIVCSEALPGFTFTPLKPKTVHVIK